MWAPNAWLPSHNPSTKIQRRRSAWAIGRFGTWTAIRARRFRRIHE